MKSVNLFDSMPGEAVQLRDDHGEVLWEGVPVNGAITAKTSRSATVRWLTKVDGTPLYDFFVDTPRVLQPSDSFLYRPDFTFTDW